MSRIELGGHEGPNPIEALPSTFSPDTPSYVIDLPNGSDFIPEVYIRFGYTHYEVWCIGAAGAQGGNVGVPDRFPTTTTRPRMSSSDWALYLEMQHIYNDPLGITYTHTDPVSHLTTVISMDQWYNEQYPLHDPFYVTTYQPPLILDDATAIGGAGGGGGVHVVTGALADLPASCHVVVGQAGVYPGHGQSQVNGALTPLPDYLDLFYSPANTRLKVLNNYFTEWQNEYPLPHTSFLPPKVGGDGGKSSFGGTICRASGGKGGNPAVVWAGASLILDGAGGAGGVGNRDTPGGGAVGVNSSGNGVDGTWDGTIGQGGSGGHGGASRSALGTWDTLWWAV